MNPITVSSGGISFVQYDENTNSLEVAFSSGEKYLYFNVPVSTYSNFLTAPSKGVYLMYHVEDQYAYRRIS